MIKPTTLALLLSCSILLACGGPADTSSPGGDDGARPSNPFYPQFDAGASDGASGDTVWSRRADSGGASADSSGGAADAQSADSGASSGASLSNAVKTGCFGWPAQSFSKSNHARTEVFLSAGDKAIELTLSDRAGKAHTLSQLLQQKPVLLVSGSYTCPVYQNRRKGIADLAARYGDKLHVVHVYTVEAHPKDPDPSPYRGAPWPQKFSSIGQATTYAGRVANAKKISLAAGEQMLVDSLSAGNENAFWCSYGTCPNCGFLIAKDGTIAAVHDWYDTPSMDGSIRALLGL